MPRFVTFTSHLNMSELSEEVSVVDVYDLASDIGKECEKIIDIYGSDSVSSLIPKCIRALELLEALASRYERETSVIQELNDRITQLENEKVERAETRKRFEKELEAIEEQWRTETRDLVSVVSRLQDENKRLAKEQSKTPSSSQPVTPTKISNLSVENHNFSLSSDGQILQKLQAQIDKQRDDLRKKDHDLQEKSDHIDQLNIQIERLKNAGRESRRRQKLMQVQVRTLCEERADFLAQMQDQHREIITLKKRLGIAEKENEDLVKCTDEDDPQRPRFTTAELKEVLAERNELKSRINELEEELMSCKPLPETLPKTESPVEEDPPVQGPLPYEPDDAPFKRQKSTESGIRKFFRKLFSENGDGTSSFPRRSLSTLSKMALSASPHTDIPI